MWLGISQDGAQQEENLLFALHLRNYTQQVREHSKEHILANSKGESFYTFILYFLKWTLGDKQIISPGLCGHRRFFTNINYTFEIQEGKRVLWR